MFIHYPLRYILILFLLCWGYFSLFLGIFKKLWLYKYKNYDFEISFSFDVIFFPAQVQLREEDRRYREYLASLQEEEKRKERELQQMIQKELDAAWERRLNQWAAEKLIRRKLLEEVLAGRQEQIKERRESYQCMPVSRYIGFLTCL